MKKYAYEYKDMSTAFNNMEFCHSISGGYTDVPVDKLYETISNMDSSWEICCTYKEQPMGDIGLYVRGTALIVSNQDLNSFCDETKHRYFDDKYGEIITSPDEMWKYDCANSEAIITEYERIGLWVTMDYYFDYSDEIESLASRLNLKLTLIEESMKAGAWMYDDEDEEDLYW